MAAGIWHSFEALVSQQAKHEIVEHSHGLGSLPLQSTAIFMQGVVATIVKLVLDAPVTAAQLYRPSENDLDTFA
jgi:hypothetical protein